MLRVAVLWACALGVSSGWADEPLKKLGKAVSGNSGTLSPVATLPQGSWVNSLAFSPDGKLLAIGLKDEVRLLDVATREVRSKLPAKLGRVRALAFSSNSRLAVGGYQKIELWNVETSTRERELSGHRGVITGLAVSSDGQRLASCSDDETARIWTLSSNTAVTLTAHFPVNGVAWSPDGTQLATAAGDEFRPTKAGEVTLWSANGESLKTWTDHTRAALCVAFTPDGKRLVSGGLDEKAIVHDLGAPPAAESVAEKKSVRDADVPDTKSFDGHNRPVNALASLPDGHTVISIGGGRATGGNRVVVWDLNTLKELGGSEDHEAKPTALSITRDGKLAATGGQDERVLLWGLASLAPGPAGRESAENAGPARAGAKQDVIRVGIIGLDTSHAPAFAKLMNDAKDDSIQGCKVVAAYPKGSPDIKSSTERVPGYVEEFKKLDIEIVDSIPALLEKVDCVCLETNDGRPHLEQALPVLKAGKPCFIDKPIAGSLTDTVAIFEAAKHYKTPVFSSSSLRYVPGALEARAGKLGDVLGCDAYSPCALEATHPDLFWYGIHGVELLFTAMGTGCESVSRSHSDIFDEAVGVWKGGRIGTFRGIRPPAEGEYGGRAFGTKANAELGTYAGYKPLVVEIVKFFKTKELPVAETETLEIYAFMEAADESKRRGGVPVKLSDVLEKARAEAAKKLPDLLK